MEPAPEPDKPTYEIAVEPTLEPNHNTSNPSMTLHSPLSATTPLTMIHQPTPHLLIYKKVPPPNPQNLAIPEHPNIAYIVKIQIMLTLLFIPAVQGQAAAEGPNLPQLVVVVAVAEAPTVRVSQPEIAL